jgi:hypothetical protein
MRALRPAKVTRASERRPREGDCAAPVLRRRDALRPFLRRARRS